MPADLVWTAGETRTCLSVAAEGGLTEFYERGEPPGADAWAAFAARVAAVAARADRVAISGSLPPGVPASAAGALVAGARAAGARVAVDLAGDALAAALAAGPDLVKVNAAEAGDHTGDDDPAAAALALHEQLAAAAPDRAVAAPDATAAPDPVVVVTLGERGALLLAGGALVHGTLDVRAPYPVGSGDAFLAGLLADPRAAWRDAFALALGAGAANAELAGAGRLDPGRARTLAGRVVLREIQRIGSAR